MKIPYHVIYNLILALAHDPVLRAAIYDALAEWQRRFSSASSNPTE